MKLPNILKFGEIVFFFMELLYLRYAAKVVPDMCASYVRCKSNKFIELRSVFEVRRVCIRLET